MCHLTASHYENKKFRLLKKETRGRVFEKQQKLTSDQLKVVK